MNGVGLVDGFSGYLNHDEQRSAALVQRAVVVPDTNVLLNLYKYNPQTRADMFKALDSVGERLWVPHQVVLEFWRNRRRVITEHRDRIRKLQDAIGKYPAAVQEDVERYRKITRDQNEAFTQHAADLAAAVDALADLMGQALERLVDPAAPTAEDPVLETLQRLLDGKVEPKPSAEEWAQMLQDGQRRAREEVPPGYLDAEKSQSEYASGDYLVWRAAMSEALRRELPLVVITGDVKDDWWARSREHLLGPRPELVAEFEAAGGHALTLLQPTDFLIFANKYLSVDVDPASIENTADDHTEAEWDEEAIAELLFRLDMEGAWQANVLRAAARNKNAALSRSDIYRIANRDLSAKLTGWTRPLHRITRNLQEDFCTGAGVDDFLTTVYEGGNLERIQLTPAVAAMILAVDEKIETDE